jgi:transcriptional regulator with XRE-family HTH domain
MPRSIRSSEPKQQPPGVEITNLTITNQIGPLLRARELSPEECARRIRLSSRQLARIIKGGVPKLDVALALETVLATPLKEIFPPSVQTRRVR